uniref:Putative wd40 domain protein n=1 Tax=Xenopsylla cheopis TaxID=163159 RepID=A0A6M2DP17_XENCH
MDNNNPVEAPNEDLEDVYNEEDFTYVGDVEDFLDELEEVSCDEEYDPPRDDSIRTFTLDEDDESAFCIAIHPDDKMYAAGTEADKLYVWHADGVNKCSFDFEDSVICVEFSTDGTLLAATDMAGNLKVYDVTKNPFNVVFEYEVGDTQFLIWHKQAHVVFCGSITGDIYVLKVPTGDCKMLLGHGVKVNCASLMADGLRLAAGYLDGAVKIWDIKSTTVQNQINADSQIISIDTHIDNKLIMIGTEEGNMSLINGAKVLNTIRLGDSVESVIFYNNPELNLAAVGCLNGTIVIWDVAKNALRHKLELRKSVILVQWLPGAKIISAHLDGCVRIHDGRSGVLESVFMGHKRAILDFAISKNHKTFATASDDSTAKLFDLTNPPQEEMES